MFHCFLKILFYFFKKMLMGLINIVFGFVISFSKGSISDERWGFLVLVWKKEKDYVFESRRRKGI